MKQLGNLAIVCAQRPSLLMQLHDGRVSVHAGSGPDRVVLCADPDNNEQIESIIYELNFGSLAERKAS